LRYDIWIVLYLYTFVLTLVLELPVVIFISAKFLKKSIKRSVVAGLLAQLATHPLFIGVLPVVVVLLKDNPYQMLEFINNIYVKELAFIPLVEAGIYYLILKPEKKWFPFVISYAANLTSWGIGYLIPMKWIIEMMR
jgi:hypothetical protein